jgi:hypothetical protein
LPDADRRAAARRLRLAAFTTALVAAFRFGLTTQSDLIPAHLAAQIEVVFDALSLLALAILANATRVAARRSPPGSTRRVLYAASALIGLGLGVEFTLWLLSRLEIGIALRSEPALLAVALWAAGRATLWFGLLTWMVRLGQPAPAPLAALVPIGAGLRLILFLGTLFAPYLEAGGEARQLYLSTAVLRNWIALSLAIVCDGAIAWLAGRAGTIADSTRADSTVP